MIPSKWYIETDDSILRRVEDLKRRVKDTVAECYPDMIQEMIKGDDYNSLIRYAEAFRYRKEFTDNYVDKTGTGIDVRDVHDLIAYMSLNSEASIPVSMYHEQAVSYIQAQCDLARLLYQVCVDQHEEMYEMWYSHIVVSQEELFDNLRLISAYLDTPQMNEIRVFCTSSHEMKAVKPREIFATLSVAEQLEIVRGEWRKVNMLTRSTLYPVFLFMVYRTQVNMTREVCMRHPYLLVARNYIEELALLIVSSTKSEQVVRRMVEGYHTSFDIDPKLLINACLQRLITS